MVVDDAQLVVALIGVRGEAVGGQRVGHRLHRRSQSCVDRRPHRAPDSPAAIARPYSCADLFGHGLGLLAGQQGQGLARATTARVVAAHRHIDRDVGDRAVALRGSTGAGALGTLDGHLEVAAGRELSRWWRATLGCRPNCSATWEAVTPSACSRANR